MSILYLIKHFFALFSKLFIKNIYHFIPNHNDISWQLLPDIDIM